MTLVLWRIAADTDKYKAEDLTGAGAAKSGGRWNKKDVPALYCATSISLACMETVVHLNALPFNRFLIRIEVPDLVAKAAVTRGVNTLPIGWDAEPSGHESIQLGTEWLQSASTCLLFVPSIIVPEEQNVVINPSHPDSAKITATKVRKWTYDPRFRGKK